MELFVGDSLGEVELWTAGASEPTGGMSGAEFGRPSTVREFPGGAPLSTPVLEPESPTIAASGDIEHTIEREDIDAPVSDDIEHRIDPDGTEPNIHVDIEHRIDPENFKASVVDDIEHSIEVEHLDSTGQDDIELKIESDDVGFMPEVLNF